jgi:hypothetical protein
MGMTKFFHPTMISEFVWVRHGEDGPDAFGYETLAQVEVKGRWKEMMFMGIYGKMDNCLPFVR